MTFSCVAWAMSVGVCVRWYGASCRGSVVAAVLWETRVCLDSKVKRVVWIDIPVLGGGGGLCSVDTNVVREIHVDPWWCVIQKGIEQQYGESPDTITAVRWKPGHILCSRVWVNAQREQFGNSQSVDCWSSTSLCHSNGHIETMPAREINPFTALTRIRSQFLRTQWSTSNHSEWTRLLIRPLSHRAGSQSVEAESRRVTPGVSVGVSSSDIGIPGAPGESAPAGWKEET